MEYRNLGGSDLKVSAVTFGAWAVGGWMWGGTERSEAVDAVRAAYEAGVTSIDTAPVYGQGLSEEIVGEAIEGLSRDKVQILTKYGLRWDQPIGAFHFKSADNRGKPIDIYRDASKESVIRECEESLRRLGTDYIDLYQIHWPDPTTPMEETMEAVRTLVSSGKVRCAGVCNFDASQMKEAEKYITLVSNQVPYSMVRREIETELLPYAMENGKSILVYSPLQLGLLTGKMRPGQKFGDGDHRSGLRYFTDENIRRTNGFLDAIRSIAESKNATLAQLVIRWTIERPGITVALVGARNSKQAVENALAAELRLSSEEIASISRELDTLQLLPAGHGGQS